MISRDFVKFGCKNRLFDCRDHSFVKKVVLGAILLLCAAALVFCIFLCRKILKRKYDDQVRIQVNHAVEKYLVKSGDSLGIK